MTLHENLYGYFIEYNDRFIPTFPEANFSSKEQILQFAFDFFPDVALTDAYPMRFVL